MKTFSEKKPLSRNSLGELLREVRVPQKSEQEWQKLENDLFLRLDAPPSVRPHTGRLPVFPFFSFPRPAFAWAAAAVVALAVVGAGVAVALRGDGKASVACLVNVKGALSVTWDGKGTPQTITSLTSRNAARVAGPKTVFRTFAGQTAIIRLDRGSILSLGPDSRLTIEASSPSRQVCFLSTGSVLVKVHKRAPGQRFEIRTPCASCRVVGTVFRVDARGESQTTLSVYQGKVKLTPSAGIAGGETYVETGRQLSVGTGMEPEARMLTAAQRPIHEISMLGMLVDQDANDIGLLDIASVPAGAKVLLNGAMAGKAPLIAKAFKGVNSIVICGDGFQPLDTQVMLGDNGICEIRAALPPLAPERKSSCLTVQASRHPFHRTAMPVRPASSESELQTMPDYIEALVDMASGEYQAALTIFDSLSNNGVVDIRGRMCLMEKINACYAKIGDFTKASDALEERCQQAQTAQDKGQLLWEISVMRANCLGDYEGAEMALVEFLILQPNAIWAHSAYGRLAEIQYYLGKYDAAAETYERHIATFPDDPDIDKSMFNLACIMGKDLNDCDKAARWYSRLIDSFHASKYRAAAFFRRGECEVQMGKDTDARRDFGASLVLSPDGAWREMCLANINKLRTTR
jgi:TolA-binding protein